MFKEKIMIQENTQIDQITVMQDGMVCIRTCKIVTNDGVEISRTYVRQTVSPNSNVTMFPENVQAICGAAWTPEIISAYVTKISKINI
jgi:hypothetical protein